MAFWPHLSPAIQKLIDTLCTGPPVGGNPLDHDLLCALVSAWPGLPEEFRRMASLFVNGRR